MLCPIFKREIEEYPGKPEKRKSSVLDAWNSSIKREDDESTFVGCTTLSAWLLGPQPHHSSLDRRFGWSSHCWSRWCSWRGTSAGWGARPAASCGRWQCAPPPAPAHRQHTEEPSLVAHLGFGGTAPPELVAPGELPLVPSVPPPHSTPPRGACAPPTHTHSKPLLVGLLLAGIGASSVGRQAGINRLQLRLPGLGLPFCSHEGSGANSWMHGGALQPHNGSTRGGIAAGAQSEELRSQLEAQKVTPSRQQGTKRGVRK